MPRKSCGRLGCMGVNQVWDDEGRWGAGRTVRSADDEVDFVRVYVVQCNVGAGCRGLRANVSDGYIECESKAVVLTPLSKTHSIVSPCFSGRDLVVISPSSPSGSNIEDELLSITNRNRSATERTAWIKVLALNHITNRIRRTDPTFHPA